MYRLTHDIVLGFSITMLMIGTLYLLVVTGKIYGELLFPEPVIEQRQDTHVVPLVIPPQKRVF